MQAFYCRLSAYNSRLQLRLLTPTKLLRMQQQRRQVQQAAGATAGQLMDFPGQGRGCPFAAGHSSANEAADRPHAHDDPTTTSASSKCATAAELEAAKPFEDIPGPTQLPLLGTAWELMLPKNRQRPLHMVMLDRMRRFGKIYRDKLPGLPETVMIHSPVDVEAMFRHEGKLPRRMPLTTWKRVRRELGLGRGVFLQYVVEIIVEIKIPSCMCIYEIIGLL